MAEVDSERLHRSLVYELLGRLWAQEPGDLLHQLAEEPLASAWRDLGGTIPQRTDDSTRTSLDEDYCRLFIGPSGHLPPLQSVWTTGELDRGVKASLSHFESVVDFALPWNFVNMPDHLGNELWAMARILSKSANLTGADAEIADDLARQFFIRHLDWADPLLNAVIQREHHRFYGTVASITLQFLDDEALRFETTAAR